jgi:hypothetical protein
LRISIEKAESISPPSIRGLPPWAGRLLIKIARRELEDLGDSKQSKTQKED